MSVLQPIQLPVSCSSRFLLLDYLRFFHLAAIAASLSYL